MNKASYGDAVATQLIYRHPVTSEIGFVNQNLNTYQLTGQWHFGIRLG